MVKAKEKLQFIKGLAARGGQLAQSRLQITSVKAKFDADGGHESPRGTDLSPFSQCGRALPDTITTWIQYPSDRDSNSYPFGPTIEPLSVEAVLFGLNGLQPWRGDCFHPNEAGAQAYADAVIEDLRKMGR
jgi:hypothetical protein